MNLTTADLSGLEQSSTTPEPLLAALGFSHAAVIVGRISNPSYADSRDQFFAALTGDGVNGSVSGTPATGLPVDGLHPAAWNPNPDISTPSGHASQSIFAGSSAKEDGYLLLEMPVFAASDRDVQGDGAHPDGFHCKPADPSTDYTMGDSAFASVIGTGGAGNA